jgi:AcrR family transcriptional regulator
MARPRSDIRDRLVEAARERFLVQGVDGASLREIAAAARTGIGMVYYYFPTKDDLFLAVVEATYAGLVRDVEALLQRRTPDEPFAPRLERLYRRAWSLSEEEFISVRLVLREALVSSERVRKIGERFLRGHLPQLAQLLIDGAEEGSLRDDLPPLARIISVIALGMVPVLARRVAASAFPFEAPSAEEAARIFTDLLLHGQGRPR